MSYQVGFQIHFVFLSKLISIIFNPNPTTCIHSSVMRVSPLLDRCSLVIPGIMPWKVSSCLHVITIRMETGNCLITFAHFFFLFMTLVWLLCFYTKNSNIQTERTSVINLYIHYIISRHVWMARGSVQRFLEQASFRNYALCKQMRLLEKDGRSFDFDWWHWS